MRKQSLSALLFLWGGREKGPLREGAVSEADWGSMRNLTGINSLRLA